MEKSAHYLDDTQSKIDPAKRRRVLNGLSTEISIIETEALPDSSWVYHKMALNNRSL